MRVFVAAVSGPSAPQAAGPARGRLVRSLEPTLTPDYRLQAEGTDT